MPRYPLFLALLLSLSTHADIYKWVDENGKVQYSDKPPPALTKSGVTQLNQQGVAVKQTEGLLTPEQRAAKEAALAKQREDQQKQDDARRRDKALMNSFSNTKEIDALRDRNVEQLKAAIQADASRREATEKRLEEYNKSADRFTRMKKPIPQDITDAINQRRDELDKLDQDVQQKKQDIETVKEKAEADKKRLVELRGNIAK
ncbi:MAG: DUF4124 domain-containing protein [Burkholderiales bacterium]|nr:DUF4124 domain-containing protein [Burkholderiales bacterium]